MEYITDCKSSLKFVYLVRDDWILTPDNTNFYNFIKKYINEENSQNIIEHLSSCRCCQRHRQKKPISLYNIDNLNNDNMPINENCKCPCRHFSRMCVGTFKND